MGASRSPWAAAKCCSVPSCGPAPTASKRASLEAVGATVIELDRDDASAIKTACADASCIISALNGLHLVMIGMQGKLLDAAVAACVPRCDLVQSTGTLSFHRPD